MRPQANNANASRELQRLLIGAAAGALVGGLIGAAVSGYMQLLAETPGLIAPDLELVFIAAFVGGIGGAVAGAGLGLVVALLLILRGGRGVRVKLR